MNFIDKFVTKYLVKKAMNDEVLIKAFLKGVWRASAILSIKRPKTTMTEIIKYLYIYIDMLKAEQERINKNKKGE